jgi:hypothetical protein
MAALVAMFRSASSLPTGSLSGVAVWDGNGPGNDADTNPDGTPDDTGDVESDATEVLGVGFMEPDDDAAAEATIAYGDLGSSQDRETYSVSCIIAVLIGDMGALPARTRAFAIFSAVGQLIRDDPKLRNSVMKAKVGTWALRQDATTGGQEMRLRFTVAVDAFTNR